MITFGRIQFDCCGVSIGVEFDSRISLTIKWQGNVKYVRHVCNGRGNVDWSTAKFEPRTQLIAWFNVRPRKPPVSSDNSKIIEIKKNSFQIFCTKKPWRRSVDSTSGTVVLDAICCCRVVGGTHRLIKPLSIVWRLSH